MSGSEFILLITLAILIVVFITNLAPPDLAAAIAVAVFILSGVMPSSLAFSGFSSPAIITIISTFFIGQALKNTGLAGKLASFIQKKTKGNTTSTIAAVTLLSAFISAFMSNIATAAIMLPITINIASAVRIAPSKLLIPMAFGTIMGGMLTLIGTSTNIIMGSVVLKLTGENLGFFAFFPAAAAILTAGTVLLCFLGKLLPDKDITKAPQISRKDLVSFYRLSERIITLKVPKKWEGGGITVDQLSIASLLKCQILSILRGKEHISPVGPKEKIYPNDLITVRGKLSRLKQVTKLKFFASAQLDTEFLKKHSLS
ncbi:MAG: SLC13 family permease, partial [Candidatus Dadabacteria bacterium]